MCVLRFALFFFLIEFGTGFVYVVQAQEKKVAAKIHVRTIDDAFEFSFTIVNLQEINRSLSYKASTIMTTNKGVENSSDTNQGGKFVLAPLEQKVLSKSVITGGDDNRIIVLLLIFDEDRLVAKDRIVVNGLESDRNPTKVVVERGEMKQLLKENGSAGDVELLRGMVVEDTKTKAGRDFYQMLYSRYLENNIDGEKVVKIIEELAVGGNTQIKVMAGDDVVAKFFVNPRTSYLEAMSKQCIFRLIHYFRTLRENKMPKTQY